MKTGSKIGAVLVVIIIAVGGYFYIMGGSPLNPWARSFELTSQYNTITAMYENGNVNCISPLCSWTIRINDDRMRIYDCGSEEHYYETNFTVDENGVLIGKIKTGDTSYKTFNFIYDETLTSEYYDDVVGIPMEEFVGGSYYVYSHSGSDYVSVRVYHKPVIAIPTPYPTEINGGIYVNNNFMWC